MTRGAAQISFKEQNGSKMRTHAMQLVYQPTGQSVITVLSEQYGQLENPLSIRTERIQLWVDQSHHRSIRLRPYSTRRLDSHVSGWG